MYVISKCPQCGAEFKLGKSCPQGHGGPYTYELVVSDCEIRDFDRFALLTHSVQSEIISVIERGRGPSFLYSIFVKLRDAGVLVCG